MQKSIEPGGLSVSGIGILAAWRGRMQHAKLLTKMATAEYRRKGDFTPKYDALSHGAVALEMDAQQAEKVIINCGGLLCLVEP